MDFRRMRSNKTSSHLITAFGNMALIQDVSHISRWKSWFLEQLSLQGMPQHLFQFVLFVRLDTQTLDYRIGSRSFLFVFEISCTCHVTHLWKSEYCFLLFISGCHTNLKAGSVCFNWAMLGIFDLPSSSLSQFLCIFLFCPESEHAFLPLLTTSLCSEHAFFVPHQSCLCWPLLSP